ncbi:MAG: C25 family cysteine peptidase [bacterium]
MMRIFIFLLVSLTFSFTQEFGARYLIITHDSFYDDILPLAEWKHKKGMQTKIAKLSEIGSDSLSIKNYIVNAYNTWEIQPEFLLLVGAPNYVPFPVISGWHTDNFYTNIDTTDIYNEILSGRLTVHNSTEAQTVVNKILLYERTPHTGDSLWFKKACLILRNDYDPGDTVYWGDVHHAKNLMLQAGYDAVDTLASEFGNNASDVVQRVNSGRSFVMYRGQGVNNWWSPFNVDPHSTANGPKLPIVMSFTCCMLGTGSSPAVAEQWFLTGTPTTPRGAAGYFATTTVGGGSITFRRSRVSRGFFSAIFTDSVRTFGQACEGGRLLVYSTYNAATEYRGFTTIGDPEMNIWTDSPQAIQVTHPNVVPTGYADFIVNVSHPSTSTPMNNATVCVTGRADSTVYAVESTDANGDAHFVLFPLIVGDDIYITVTGRNLRPYEGSMETVHTGYEEVKYTDDFLRSALDVFPNPGTHRISIKYDLGIDSKEPLATKITLQVYDTNGRLVRRLIEDGLKSSNRRTTAWSGDDALGRALPGGVYFIVLRSGHYTITKTITLLK